MEAWLYGRFEYSTNNWELATLQLEVTSCIRLPRGRDLRHPILLPAVPQEPSWKAPVNVAFSQTSSCHFGMKRLST